MGILMESVDVNLGSGYRNEVFAMGTPTEYYAESLRTIALNTRETAYESIVDPIPITLKTYKQYHMNGHPINYFPPQQMTPTYTMPMVPVALEVLKPSTSTFAPNTTSPAKVEVKEDSKVQPPPKKKWIKEYLEKPKSPLPVRVVTALPVVGPCANGVVVRAPSPPPLPAALAPESALAPYLDFTQEHSRPRTTSNSHGPPQIPSPPSVSSSGSNGSGSSLGGTPRAGTREVHNKLEKNRRAHLKECFELLKRQLPTAPEDKKTSNLSILGSAIRCIQVLRRKDRECEHEMERLAREKIAAQQRLAALKREVSVLASASVRTNLDTVIEDKPRDERVNGQVLGIPISITSSGPVGSVGPVGLLGAGVPLGPSGPRLEASPPRTLNLSTKLRTLPIQITPTNSQVVRTSYGARHNTLTLTTIAPADQIPCTTQSGAHENGVGTAGATLVHPAQIHLPISQMVSGGGLVVGGALQLVSPAALRLLHAAPSVTPTTRYNGLSTNDNNRILRDNGLVSPPPCTETNGNVVMSGLRPLVVSAPPAAPTAAPVLHSHTLTHKMMETQMIKGNVAPLTVNAQYLSATTIVKPVVMVSSSVTPPSTSA